MGRGETIERRTVTATGVGVSVLSLVAWSLGDDGWARNAIEVLLPAVVGLCIVALGERLRRGNYASDDVRVVAASTVVGGSLFVVLELWITLIAKPSPGPGPDMVAIFVFMLNRAAAGMLGAGVLAVLYVRIRQQNAELQQLTHRLKDRNRSLNRQTAKLETQNQRLNQLARIVSHDLRNPLNVAMGRSELARDTGDIGHIEAVENALTRMETIIEDMLALVSQGQLVESTQSIQLGAIAKAAWETVPTGGVTLDVTVETYVDADEDRCRHVFENLFRNAIEHGGPELSTVRVGPTEDGFYVADDGVGIPPSDRAAIFEPGFSTTEEGSGLGMVITEAIVEAHGWTIDVSESEMGGARFDIGTDTERTGDASHDATRGSDAST